MLGAHPVQEGSGPCKIPNLSHLLWSYGTHLLARDEVNQSYLLGEVEIMPEVDGDYMKVLRKGSKVILLERIIG